MKIIYYNYHINVYDGSYTHATGMLKALQTILGKDNIYVFPQPKEVVSHNLTLEFIKMKSKKVMQLIRVIRKYLLSYYNQQIILSSIHRSHFRPDAIIARAEMFDYSPAIIARKLGIKLILEMNTPMYYEAGILRGLPFFRLIENWERSMLYSADIIYVVSKEIRDLLVKHYHISKEKFVIIPNGYMAHLYQENAMERENIRKYVRYNFGLMDKFIVVFVGSLKAWHGIENLLKLASIMSSYDDIVFWVVGDGEKRDVVIEYLKANKTKNLYWFGKVDFYKMRDLLYTSDLGIMPYAKIDYFYFSPLKMYDMIGAGLPFIGTNIGQIADLCHRYLSDDFLVENNEPETLFNAIFSIYINSQKRKEMQERVLAIRKYFTWESRAKELLTFINNWRQK